MPTVLKADGECQAKLEGHREGVAREGLCRAIGGVKER